MPLVATRGAASAQGFGEFAQSAAPNYIEQVFQTWLYTGNGSTQTITNGIDLAGKGGLVWIKARNSGTQEHLLLDAANNYVRSNSTDEQNSLGYSNPSSIGGSIFNSNGFTAFGYGYNTTNGTNYVSWTFRKQPKFFDIVTYTGNGTSGRTVSHNLGSVPGCIIVKRTDLATQWYVYHRSLGATKFLELAAIAVATTGSYAWNDADPTSTNFTVGNGSSVNTNGATYVAYLFAHDAGGFGLSGTDNVISCGSYTGNGSSTGPTVTLGYEPQWLMIKPASQAGNWFMFNNMQGMPVGGDDNYLFANTSGSENVFDWVAPTATGFYPTQGNTINANGQTYIYIAIRRGPMKTPTTGTSVFAPQLGPSSGSFTYTPNFPVDWFFEGGRTGTDKWFAFTRLTGNGRLQPNNTGAEDTVSATVTWASNTSVTLPGSGTGDFSNYIGYLFRRAPGFFDVVCYTGTGATNKTKNHNLGAVPELMIIKNRGPAGFTQNWAVYPGPLGTDKYMFLNTTAAAGTFGAYWDNTPPTSTTFSVGNYQDTNASTLTYVAYLFATVAGVSKVGSYTGTGTTLQIDCGFTSGARFVLIKRTDSTGDWYVWDSARGIVAGNDPYLLLNSTAAEVTNTDYVDTYSAGFEISSTAPAAINANGGTFIFLAIA